MDDGVLEESVGSNRWYQLARDEQGYVLHAKGGGPDTRFPNTDEGAEQAWDEFKRRSDEAQSAHRSASFPRWLFAAVVVIAIAWMITGIVSSLAFFGSSLFNQSWFRWTQIADQMLYHFLIGSTAVLVSWWVYLKLSESSRRG